MTFFVQGNKVPETFACFMKIRNKPPNRKGEYSWSSTRFFPNVLFLRGECSKWVGKKLPHEEGQCSLNFLWRFSHLKKRNLFSKEKALWPPFSSSPHLHPTPRVAPILTSLAFFGLKKIRGFSLYFLAKKYPHFFAIFF